MTGEECPIPGTGTFQRTFFGAFRSHCTGADVGLRPEAAGPRNCGQFSSAKAQDVAKNTMNMTSDRIDIAVMRVYQDIGSDLPTLPPGEGWGEGVLVNQWLST